MSQMDNPAATAVKPCTASRLWNAIKMLIRKRNVAIYLLGLEVIPVIPVGHTLKCSLGVKRPSHRNPM